MGAAGKECTEVKFAVVAYSDSFVQCLGVFDCAATAYGEAVIYLSGIADKDHFLSPLIELECDTGYALELRRLGRPTIETVYILFAENEEPHGCAQSQEAKHETPNV